ncbi:DUF2188 domain-containing protein [Bacillus tianshenii]|nr:DUF2188 domain-containing protein [Bacillus tianshenii]
MPWTKNDYPSSMKNLPSDVRNKAIEIANSLVEKEGMEEGRAIAIATSQAEKSEGDNSDAGDKLIYHVQPQDEEWAVMKEGAKQASYTFSTKNEAMDKGRELMNNNDCELIVHKRDGSIQDRINNDS